MATTDSGFGMVTEFANSTRMETAAANNVTVTGFENSTNWDIICQNKLTHTVYFTLYLTAICVLILCNILLLAAIATNWGTLRQNIVYRYLISCLVSTTCFCFLGGYEICHFVALVDDNIVEGGTLQRYDSNNTVQENVMRGWAYRKSLAVCFFIIMEFNIAVFIHAMCDNTHFVGRFGDLEHSNDNRRNKQLDATKRKKSKAVWLILASWIFPLILSIPTGFGWNCMEHCECLPAFRPELTCFSPESGVICSRVWLPTTRSFGIVITVLYFGSILFMFGMLIVVVRKFYKIHAPKKTEIKDQDTFGSKRNAMDTKRAHSTDEATTQDSRASDAQESGTAEPKVEGDFETQLETQESMNELREKSCTPARVQIARNARPPLHSTIKLLIALTVALFISMTPMVLIWFCDFLIYPGPMTNQHAFDVSLGLTYAYSVALPFILLRYMSGLRKACVNMLLRCPCLRTTVITKKRITATIRRTRKKTQKTETCVTE